MSPCCDLRAPPLPPPCHPLQAEAVSSLVSARTVAAADSALAGLAGGLGREVGAMRADVIDMLVELDAR